MEQSNHRSELFGPIVSRSNSKVSRDEIERLGDPVRGRSKSRETTYLTRTLPCTSSHLCFLCFRRTPSARHNSFPESSFQSAICNLGTNAANLFGNGPSLLHFFRSWILAKNRVFIAFSFLSQNLILRFRRA